MASRMSTGSRELARSARVLGAAASLALAAGCNGGAGHAHPSAKTPEEKEVRRCAAPRFRVVDLTHPMREDMPFWPGGVPFKMTRLVDYDQGYRLHRFEMGENTGTHVDAPSHFARGKRSAADIPVGELVAPAAVLDVRDKVERDADYLVSVNDVVDYESAHGPLPPGAIVIANTGWHARWRDPASYVNQDAAGTMHFPGFAGQTAELLIERDIAGVGIDTLSLDHGPSKDFPAHHAVLGANKIGIENLANLGKLPAAGATVIVGVLAVHEGSQAQARVVALVPEER
jgi:kynurenine formamidase